MGVIYSFSAQGGTESTGVSRGICYRTGAQVQQITGTGWDEKECEEIAAGVEFPIRKMAHMTEYGILGILFLGTMLFTQKAYGMRIFFAQLGTTLYAATDEFHQTFVPGRSGSVRDVLIDSAGCVIALGIFTWIRYWRRKRVQ